MHRLTDADSVGIQYLSYSYDPSPLLGDRGPEGGPAYCHLQRVERQGLLSVAVQAGVLVEAVLEWAIGMGTRKPAGRGPQQLVPPSHSGPISLYLSLPASSGSPPASSTAPRSH